METNESAAPAARDRATDDDDFAYLREMCPPGTTVYTLNRKVSRSGMSRVISMFVIGKGRDGKPRLLWLPSPRVATVTGYRDDKKADGNVVPGCGMDMHFQLVYTLSGRLYKHLTSAEIQKASARAGRTSENTNPGYLLTKESI